MKKQLAKWEYFLANGNSWKWKYVLVIRLIKAGIIDPREWHHGVHQIAGFRILVAVESENIQLKGKQFLSSKIVWHKNSYSEVLYWDFLAERWHKTNNIILQWHVGTVRVLTEQHKHMKGRDKRETIDNWPDTLDLGGFVLATHFFKFRNTHS